MSIFPNGRVRRTRSQQPSMNGHVPVPPPDRNASATSSHGAATGRNASTASTARSYTIRDVALRKGKEKKK